MQNYITLDSPLGSNVLAQMDLPPLKFVVNEILPQGIFILGGSPKVGKSWLALDFCFNVATGGKALGFQTLQGTVLYLMLEDNIRRMQDRIHKFNKDGVNKLFVVNKAPNIYEGLVAQVLNFLEKHKDVNLVCIDTLINIRNMKETSISYSNDYREIQILRQITDVFPITLLLIHHGRKMPDADPANMLSGSTGLTGAVDGLFFLDKPKRTGDDAKLTIVNRDTKEFCFDLTFDRSTCRWRLIGDSSDLSEDEETIVMLIDEFLQDEWSGTISELCKELKRRDVNFNLEPAVLGKRLRTMTNAFKKILIVIEFMLKNNEKLIYIKRDNCNL